MKELSLISKILLCTSPLYAPSFDLDEKAMSKPETDIKNTSNKTSLFFILSLYSKIIFICGPITVMLLKVLSSF